MPVEGGRGSDGDRHVIVVDRSRCRLYELFAAPAETAAGARRAFVYPARHFASELNDPDLPAMGQRPRLRRGYPIARFPRQARVVLAALKRYGMIVAVDTSRLPRP